MTKTKKKGWINLFRTHGKACTESLVIHQTKDDAIRNTFSTPGYRFPDYITTIQIEWEEEV